MATSFQMPSSIALMVAEVIRYAYFIDIINNKKEQIIKWAEIHNSPGIILF